MVSIKNAQRIVPNKYGIHSLDFLGEKFSLTYQSLNGKFQTTFGGYLTIFLGIASALVGLVVFSQLFNTQAPVVTTSLEFGSKYAKYNINEEELGFPLSFTSQGKVITDLSKYFTLKAATNYFRLNKRTGQMEGGVGRLFDFTTCDKIKDPKFKGLLNKLDVDSLLSMSFCPDLRGLEDEYFVQYDEENVDHRTIKVFIYPCSLPDQAQCAPKEAINKIEVFYANLEKFFVSSDKKKPLRELGKQSFSRIASLNTKFLNFELKKNRLIDDTSQLTSPRITKEFTSSEMVSTDTGARSEQLHCPASIINGPSSFLCEPYLNFQFSATGKTLIMSRSYKGVITVMGEFGGVVKILTGVVLFLYSFYTARKMKSYFSSRIFNLNKNQLKRLEELLARDEELGSNQK